MTTPARTLLTVALALLALPLPAQVKNQGAGVAWEASSKSALAKAKSEKKPVLWVVMIDREIACRRMMRSVWTDADVVARARNFIVIPCNPYPKARRRMFPAVSESQARMNEGDMRKRFQKPGSDIIAPQHLVSDADGKELLRQEYELDKKGLIKFLDDALAKAGKKPAVAGEGEVQPAGDVKKPDQPADEGAGEGAADKEADAAAADKEADADGPTAEGTRLLKMLPKAPEDEQEELMDAFLKTASKGDVGAFIAALSDGTFKNDKTRIRLLRRLGYDKYGSRAPEVLEALEHKSKRVRHATVVVLEEMQNPVATEPLLAMLAKATDRNLKSDLLRALGPTGVGNAEAKAVLVKAAAKKNPQGVAAIMGLAHHCAGDDEVRELLGKRWKKARKKDPARLALLYAWYTADDPDNKDTLEALKKREKKGEHYDFLETILARTEGRDPKLSGNDDKSRRGRIMRRFGAGRMAEYRLLIALRPLYEKDRYPRNAVEDMMELFRRFGRGGRGR